MWMIMEQVLKYNVYTYIMQLVQKWRKAEVGKGVIVVVKNTYFHSRVLSRKSPAGGPRASFVILNVLPFRDLTGIYYPPSRWNILLQKL